MGRRSYIVGSEFQGDADASLIVGKYTSIASGVKFQLHNNHDYSNFTTYPFHDLKIASLEPKKEKLKNQLIIGNDVWIGTNAAILGGIVIGSGAVIAANAVVTKNVEPYSIVAGNPAKILKYRFSEEVCRTLVQMKW